MENILNISRELKGIEDVPTVMIRKNISEPKDINPIRDFNGFFLHQPLDTVVLLNNMNKIKTANLFISVPSNSKNNYFVTQDSSIITICVPWNWLESVLGQFNIQFPFDKLENQIYLTEENELKSKIMEFSILYLNKDKIENSQNKEIFFLENLSCILSLLEIIKTVLGKYMSLEIGIDQEEIQNKEVKHNDPLQEVYERYICNPLVDLPKTGDMAKKLKMSITTFKIEFKNRYKCTYIQAHMAVRMNYAMQMLLNGAKVTDVSEKIGYTQPTKFIIVFKKFFRTTPGSVKKKVSFTTKYHTKRAKYAFELQNDDSPLKGKNVFFTQNESMNRVMNEL